jgi:sugar-specific transcriptional regulator TrmB
VPYVITAKDRSRAVATYEEAIDAAAEEWNRRSPGTEKWSVRFTGSSPVHESMKEIIDAIDNDIVTIYGLHNGTTINVEPVEWHELASMCGYTRPHLIGRG